MTGEKNRERLKIQCPHCESKLVVDERYAGKSVKCPKCSEKFLVQRASGGEVVPVSPTDKEEEEAGRFISRKRTQEAELPVGSVEPGDDKAARLDSTKVASRNVDEDDISEKEKQNAFRFVLKTLIAIASVALLVVFVVGLFPPPVTKSIPTPEQLPVVPAPALAVVAVEPAPPVKSPTEVEFEVARTVYQKFNSLSLSDKEKLTPLDLEDLLGKPDKTVNGTDETDIGWGPFEGEQEGFTLIACFDKNKRMILWKLRTPHFREGRIVTEPHETYFHNPITGHWDNQLNP
jgi:predicted Zn finger-like uncharacterized protein